jgi:hypothetical protein
MARTLEAKGFRVTKLLNATKRQMKEGVRSFTRGLDENSVGLFYFAGHGIEFEWFLEGGASGRGRWIFEPETGELQGTWTHTSSGDGSWNMKRK